MGLNITIESYNQYFKRAEEKLIVNDLSMLDRNVINDNLQVTLNEADISTEPKCECGATTGKLYQDAGIECSECNTPLKTIIDADYPILWFRKLGEEQLLNPQFVLMFNSTLSAKQDYFRWITDPSYKLEPSDPVCLAIQNINGFERTYAWFTKNMKPILTVASNVSKLKKPAILEKIDSLVWLIDNQGHRIFSDYLPIMSKSLFIMEDTSIGKFSDMVVASVMDTTLNFISASRSKDPKQINTTTSRLISGLALTLSDYYTQRLNGKKKFIRAHMNGLRTPGSRSVMTLLYGKRDYDEIEIPWQAFLGSYRYEIVNLMVNRGKYHYLEAINLIDTHFFREHVDLRNIVQTLMRESAYKGLPNRIVRNQHVGFIREKSRLIAA